MNGGLWGLGETTWSHTKAQRKQRHKNIFYGCVMPAQAGIQKAAKNPGLPILAQVNKRGMDFFGV